MSIKIGKNGRLHLGLLGTALKGADAEIPAAVNNQSKLYLVETLGAQSAITVKENHFLLMKGAQAISLVAGDSLIPVDTSIYCPAISWGFNPTQDTLEVTNQCSGGFNQYVPSGWATAEGTISAQFNSENGFQESMIKQFFATTTVSSDGSAITFENQMPNILYIMWMYDDVQTKTEALTSYAAGVNINSIQLTTNIKEVRTFETPCSLASRGIPTRIVELIS